jgi:hypothetical protein
MMEIEPWRALRPIIVGGLTCVGFAAVPDGEFLLVVSHDGRGVFDLAGRRIARDPTPIDDEWHDDVGHTAVGIGPLEGVRVPIAGLWGGSLPTRTEDGWEIDRRGSLVYLRHGDRQHLVYEDTVSELRAAGFSPGGTALVTATVADITLFTR